MKLERVENRGQIAAVAGGVTFSLNEQISLYGEIAHIDDMFFAAGACMTF